MTAMTATARGALSALDEMLREMSFNLAMGFMLCVLPDQFQLAQVACPLTRISSVTSNVTLVVLHTMPDVEPVRCQIVPGEFCSWFFLRWRTHPFRPLPVRPPRAMKESQESSTVKFTIHDVGAIL